MREFKFHFICLRTKIMVLCAIINPVQRTGMVQSSLNGKSNRMHETDNEIIIFDKLSVGLVKDEMNFYVKMDTQNDGSHATFQASFMR